MDNYYTAKKVHHCHTDKLHKHNAEQRKLNAKKVACHMIPFWGSHEGKTNL